MQWSSPDSDRPVICLGFRFNICFRNWFLLIEFGTVSQCKRIQITTVFSKIACRLNMASDFNGYFMFYFESEYYVCVNDYIFSSFVSFLFPITHYNLISNFISLHTIEPLAGHTDPIRFRSELMRSPIITYIYDLSNVYVVQRTFLYIQLELISFEAQLGVIHSQWLDVLFKTAVHIFFNFT